MMLDSRAARVLVDDDEDDVVAPASRVIVSYVGYPPTTATLH